MRGQQTKKRPASLDHLVGGGQQCFRDGEAERLGGRLVDHQFVFGRCLHREVGRVLAPEDAIDVAGGRGTTGGPRR